MPNVKGELIISEPKTKSSIRTIILPKTILNVYAKTEEECERLLAEMIVEMKAEIKAEKEKLKAAK